jgi:hypothetical protein
MPERKLNSAAIPMIIDAVKYHSLFQKKRNAVTKNTINISSESIEQMSLLLKKDKEC